MGLEALKLELIKWLAQLEDESTIQQLRIVKESSSEDSDWFDTLSDDQRDGINCGLYDIEANRTVAHEDVKKKYGL